MIARPKLDHIPTVLPWPDAVAGVGQCALRLDGAWERCDSYRSDMPPDTEWMPVRVPDDRPAMLRLVPNVPAHRFAYRRLLQIPADFAGNRVFLRFEAAQGYANAYLDGHLVGTHENGFLPWDLEVTQYITPGQPARILLEFENHTDPVIGDNLGGLIRSVWLLALPHTHITRFHVETVFDAQYTNATLALHLRISDPAQDTAIRLSLRDPTGNSVSLAPNTVSFEAGEQAKTVQIPIKRPLHWDAEHPRLYALTAKLCRGQTVLERTKRNIGFRQIEIIRNRTLINGREVKLRGACRHDITAHHGHTMDAAAWEKDIRLFKEANVNYIRTSHYPPSETFLDLCDKYGMYVEDETAFAFVGSTLPFSPKSPHLAQRFIDFIATLIERDRSHPSVIIWSLANESIFGRNFDLMNQYAHHHDPSRPTKFSYPMTMKEEAEPADIWSVHYNGFDAALGEKNDNLGLGSAPGADRPILHDEYVHLASYNREELSRDPAVRSFWGQSILQYWDHIWQTPGALGGAIWAGIDHTPCDADMDHYTWGIVDIWRRKKPEFWALRQAYAPIRIPIRRIDAPAGNDVMIPIENRFCHTDLAEITVFWDNGQTQGTVSCCPAPPFDTGHLVLPGMKLSNGDRLVLHFVDGEGWTVYEHAIAIGQEKAEVRVCTSPVPSCEETADHYHVSGNAFTLRINKQTGLFDASVRGMQILRKGPFLHMAGVRPPGKWRMHALRVLTQGGHVAIQCSGSYGGRLDITFRSSIDGAGLLTTEYTVDAMQMRLPWAMKYRVGVHCGGLAEWGLSYLLNRGVDTLYWKRTGLHTIYPEDHISRLCGVAHLSTRAVSSFGVEPGNPWSQDEYSYFLNGLYDPGDLGTNDFRSMKHHISWARAQMPGAAVDILSDGGDSVRMQVMHDETLWIDDTDAQVRFHGTWYRLSDAGCRKGTETVSHTPGDYAECRFHGTGIAWIGSVDTHYGIAAVYVDGTLVDPSVNNRVNIVDYAGSSIGFDKRYGKTLFSVRGLEPETHTLRIEVTGKRGLNATDTYISVDGFRILDASEGDAVWLHVVQRFNYPGLSWGNAMHKPVEPKPGDTGVVTIRLSDTAANSTG